MQTGSSKLLKLYELVSKIVIVQKYAEHLVKIGKMEHSSGLGVGENLYWSAGRGDGDDQAVAAVQNWYDEIENYSFSRGKSRNGKTIGHFTQVIHQLR